MLPCVPSWVKMPSSKLRIPYDSPLFIILAVVTAVWYSNSAGFHTFPRLTHHGEDALGSVCRVLAGAISNSSAVHWPGTPAFESDIHHWAVSGAEKSRCSVRPANVNDLSRIIQILGWTKMPFAISGGGHALNPGFSSTTGIHVSMSGFDTLEWHKDENAIDIGAGLRWDHVYDYLNPEGYTVVGGRVRGVGVAGFILGGGLSFKTNQLGLTIDTLKSCEVVLPNGTFARASHDEHPDLFFGLKGGFNNFGIVTKFTLGVYPQTDIWGGTVILAEKDIGGAHDAVVRFADAVTDPKATLNIIYEYAEGELNAIVILFYDAPSPPPGLFDELLAIPNGKVTAASMSFATLLSAGQPRNTPRRIQDVAPVQKYTPKFLDSIANETKHWGSFLEKHHSGHFFDYVVEIFLPTYYSHGTESAWPPSRDPASVHYPVNIAFAWYEKAHDQAVWDALKTSVAKLRADAEAEGQDVENAELYPNLPIEGTPLERMYGKNLPRLRALRDVYDPERVMDLTGGWRF